jgi:hypothetical protein
MNAASPTPPPEHRIIRAKISREMAFFLVPKLCLGTGLGAKLCFAAARGVARTWRATGSQIKPWAKVGGLIAKTMAFPNRVWERG